MSHHEDPAYSPRGPLPPPAEPLDQTHLTTPEDQMDGRPSPSAGAVFATTNAGGPPPPPSQSSTSSMTAEVPLVARGPNDSGGIVATGNNGGGSSTSSSQRLPPAPLLHDSSIANQPPPPITRATEAPNTLLAPSRSTAAVEAAKPIPTSNVTPSTPPAGHRHDDDDRHCAMGESISAALLDNDRLVMPQAVSSPAAVEERGAFGMSSPSAPPPPTAASHSARQRARMGDDGVVIGSAAAATSRSNTTATTVSVEPPPTIAGGAELLAQNNATTSNSSNNNSVLRRSFANSGDSRAQLLTGSQRGGGGGSGSVRKPAASGLFRAATRAPEDGGADTVIVSTYGANRSNDNSYASGGGGAVASGRGRPLAVMGIIAGGGAGGVEDAASLSTAGGHASSQQLSPLMPGGGAQPANAFGGSSTTHNADAPANTNTNSQQHRSSITAPIKGATAASSGATVRGYTFKGNNLRRIAVDNDIDSDDNDDSMVPKCFRTLPRPDGAMESFPARWWRNFRRGSYVANVFFKLSLNDASKRKGSFCLGMFSVILVVFIAAIMFTTLNNLQVIFLKLGESDSGQIDIVVTPGGQVYDANSLNYTKITQLFPSASASSLDDSLSYHSPRTIFSASSEVRLASPWPVDKSSRGWCEHPTLEGLPADRRTTAEVAKIAWMNGTEWFSGLEHDINTCEDIDCAIIATCPFMTVLVGAQIIFMDGVKEAENGLGKGFPKVFPTMPEDGVVLSTRVATALGVGLGDRFIAVLDASYPLMEAFQIAELDDYNDVFETESPSSSPQYTTAPFSVVSFVVHAVVSDSYGKLGKDDDVFIFANYAGMSRQVGGGLSPLKTTAQQRETFMAVDPQLMAGEVHFSFPPDVRSRKYVADGYDGAKSYGYGLAGRIVAPLGFNQVDVSLPLVSFLYSYRFFSMFLSLLIWIIIAALSFLSIVLIYSLLTINIESRTYELGVMRMEGFPRHTLSGLVIVGALLFAIPGWAIGLGLGQFAYVGVRQLLSSLMDAEMEVYLSASAVGYGTLAGIGIPLLASLAPVMSILTQSLPDALNTERGRTKAIDYDIERESDSYFSWTVFGMGVLSSVFGFLIYYLFPQAMMNLDLSLLFTIFFVVLLGMLSGLILLTVNFERFVEAVIQYTFLFWEHDAIFVLIERNLVAHRPRNRKSTLMFALSLGFVIFISVAFNIQMVSLTYGQHRAVGNDVLATRSRIKYKNAIAIDGLLSYYQQQGIVEHYAWSSAHYAYQDAVANVSLGTVGRYVQITPTMRAVSPRFFDFTDDSFLTVSMQNDTTDLSLGERLYTVDGSATMILSTSYSDNMALDTLSDPFELYIRNDDSQEYRVTLRTQAFVDSSPLLTFSKFPTSGFSSTTTPVDAVMSITSMVGLADGGIRSIRSLYFTSFSVSTFGDESMADQLDDVLSEFVSDMTDSVKIDNYYSQSEDLSTAKQILNFFFYFTQIMATVICFFALLSSMSTNVLHQAKEIGVLRCLGLTTFGAYRIYVWESFVLVFSASIMGLVVGTIVAYTMLLQNALLTQLPLPFEFPYAQLVIIFITSVFCAFFASYGPVKALMSLPSITHILRRTL